MKTLVLTVIGPDRRGIVDNLSEVLHAHGGNWEESRMARLGGQFAGILLVHVPAEQADGLVEAMSGLEAKGLSVVVQQSDDRRAPERHLQVAVVGADRPGIVRKIAAAIAEHGANIEELATRTESAPMSGELLFHATASLSAPEGIDLDALQARLEGIATDLMVDLEISAR
jgi:glycine cleavage system regulatory protein